MDDLDRNLDLVTRPDGAGVDLQYDAAGRLEALVAPDGTTSFGYDDGSPPLIPGTGNLVSIAAPGGQDLSFAYDGSLLTQATWSGAVSGTVSLGYDDDFRVSSQTVGGEAVVSFAYDGDGLLVQAGAVALTRHPQHGLVTATQLGSVSTALGYNAFGELAFEEAASPGLFETDYTRDALGRITQRRSRRSRAAPRATAMATTRPGGSSRSTRTACSRPATPSTRTATAYEETHGGQYRDEQLLAPERFLMRVRRGLQPL